ncbi:hypothetical protein I5L03_01115 [Erythrobacter sp. JGD-13]|uniref:Uncharacterized protein n=1 Tax=Aurantiacibacter sediminis TaxID=2793064 RepID=A0ABS0MZP1_9SPHN|nr:hypothetical protein [Aurantiacibacter sediminis]
MAKWAFLIFAIFYVIAVFLLLVGTYGWFGQERDPLSGIFLMPLGLPWNLLGEQAGLGGPALGIGAPLINAAALYWIWKR